MLSGLRIAIALLLVGVPSAAEPMDLELSANSSYERVLANRFESSVQELTPVSGDRAGREQPLRPQMLWRRYAEGSAEAKGGIQSRTLIRYLEPTDVRGSGYLVLDKSPAPDDQFMYLSSMRRTRRISLRSQTVIRQVPDKGGARPIWDDRAGPEVRSLFGREADLDFGWIDRTTSVDEGREAPKTRSHGGAEPRVDRRPMSFDLHAPLTGFTEERSTGTPGY